jgi:hypothetical protein
MFVAAQKAGQRNRHGLDGDQPRPTDKHDGDARVYGVAHGRNFSDAKPGSSVLLNEGIGERRGKEGKKRMGRKVGGWFFHVHSRGLDDPGL